MTDFTRSDFVFHGTPSEQELAQFDAYIDSARINGVRLHLSNV